MDDANKYRPFRNVETELLANLRVLMARTSEMDLKASTTTLVAGALTTALAYIAKANIKSAPQVGDTQMADLATAADPPAARSSLTSRILVLSVSGDLASQYIPVMNAIFAAQRQRIPIDILKLAGDTVFLQQACDATGGIYLKPLAPEGLLQYLMMAFLPDETARKHLVLPSAGEVDFRAACFCHRRVVDIGYVCSVCLSSESLTCIIQHSVAAKLTTVYLVFCEPPADQTCPTCTNPLSVSSSITRIPALIPRKKKKRKRVAGEATTPGGAGTPGTPGGGATPIPS